MNEVRKLNAQRQAMKVYKAYIERWKAGLETGFRCERLGMISSHIRRYLFEKFNSRCSRCGWTEVNQTSGKIPLEAEHIDGNSQNNKEENLTLLCPNCHSLTPTYRALNKGKGRIGRHSTIGSAADL